MAVLGIKDPTTKLEDVRQYIASDKNYFSILNRPIQDMLQRDEDLDRIHTPSRGIRARATDPTTDQIEIEVGTYTFGITISQFAGTTLASVPVASAGNKRIDLLYFRIDTGTVVRSPSAEAANYGAVVKINLPAGLDTIPLAYIYVGETGPDFQDGLAVDTDGAIEDLRPAPGASMGRQLETVASNMLSDVSGGSAGIAETVARSDHRHVLNVDATLPTSLTPGNTASAGAAGTYALIDHIHLIPTEANPAALLSDVSGGSAGVGATFPRVDHRHALTALGGAPGADAGAGSAGASALYARSDHFHVLNVPVGGVPAVLNPLSAPTHGVATTYAHSDHLHATTNLMQGRLIFGGVSAGGVIVKAGSSDWTSVRNGVGFYTVTFDTPLSTANFVVVACTQEDAPANMQVLKVLDVATTGFDIFTGVINVAQDVAFNFMVAVPPV